MIRQKHQEQPPQGFCEHCGDSPDCIVCGRGRPGRTVRSHGTDRRAFYFQGLRWEVFNPRTGEVLARVKSKLMAALLAWAFHADYAPAGVGY